MRNSWPRRVLAMVFFVLSGLFTAIALGFAWVGLRIARNERTAADFITHSLEPLQ